MESRPATRPVAGSPAATQEGACSTLRKATAGQHAAVEALPLMAGLMSARVDMPMYRQVLLRQWQVHAGWEQACGHWLRSLAPHWHYRPRAPALQADLRALGGQDATPVPVAPVPVDADHAWGMLYVVEGAALGGQLIARHVQAHCPGLADALSHFRGAALPGAGWRDFRLALEQALPDTAARQAAVAGARAMFRHFHAHLAEPWMEAA